ncbi:HdaA/DnaA family protein [Falsiroseomonas bella]|uniref:HdaA/DnaA family protein n=1 Tax=Falsiroseomonas bella TaxID=2184016 RepID=UPI0011B602F0|nr:chromosomal replication initiator DnaA [Falsiroseomonas bella]
MTERDRAAQLPLPLPVAPSAARADLVADASNAAALAWLDRPGDWPLHRLALFGPPGTGKSHMLRAAASDHGWRLLRGTELTEALALAEAPGTALDEAEAAPEPALFHLINRSAEAGAPLLLAAREAPARWPVALPDLASRLRATLAVGIAAPTEALLGALLAKHLADRQLRVAPEVHAWLLARIPREAAAIATTVAALDAAALAGGGAITRPLARAVLARLFGDDDGSVAEPPAASPPPGGMG